MRTKSISWGPRSDPSCSLTVGEFTQGGEYKTIRRKGTPNFLVILTLEGGGRVTGPDGQVRETKSGDILLFKPHAFHHYGTSPEMGFWNLTWSHFVPPEGWNYWHDWPSSWDGLQTFRIGPVTTGRVCDALRAVYDADLGIGELAGRFMLNCLERAWLYIRQAQDRAAGPDRDPRIAKALHYIEAHLSDPLPIAGLAEYCGLSASRFAHLFRAETGSSPQRYVETRRMERARNLLGYTSMSVTEVARACGFEDAFYFSSRFKRFAGASPSRFRNAGPAQAPAQHSRAIRA